MSFAESALSITARELRSLLFNEIDEIDEPSVLIGTPKQAAAIESNHSRLNLFFYRVEPAGYPTDARASEPMFVRVRCLITSFAVSTHQGNSKIGAGENDLRLIGAVMLALHQNPLLTLSVDDQPIAQLQIVMAKVSGEELERLWSAQGSETSYRPSVGYELALLPIPLELPKDSRPKVAAIGGTAEHRTTPPVAWAPRLWVETLDGPRQALIQAPSESPLELELSGPAGASVTLTWSQLVKNGAEWSEPLALDDEPLDEDGRASAELELPFDEPGQLLIQARNADDPSGPSSALLISVVEGNP